MRPDTDQIIRVPLDRIEPFPNHPFQVRDDDDMKDLADSVARNGVLFPALLLPVEGREDSFYYIAGHRRGLACEKASLADIPAIVKHVSMDEATIIMVDSNLQQRENILPTERGWAYRMKLEALSRQGKRSDLTSSLEETKLRSDEKLAKEIGDTRISIQRHIRLTHLIPEMVDLVDRYKMAITPAAEISFLPPDQQENLYQIIELEMVMPSSEQATKLKNAAKDDVLDYKLMHAIMKQEKANQLTIKLSTDARKRVFSYFPEDATPLEIETGILEALELRRRSLQRKTPQQTR